MADEIDVEELLRRGGQMAGADEVDVEELMRQGGQVEEEPSTLEAIGRSINRVGTLGLAPRINAAAEAAIPRFQLREGFFDPDVPTPAPVSYEEALKRNRDLQRRTADAHPVADAVTGVAVGLLHPLNKVGGTGLAGAVRGGAFQGALQGAAESEADYSKADAKEYARAFGDTLKGGVTGGAFGAAGYGVAKGLKRVGEAAGGVLRRARGELLDDARASRLAEEDAARAADVAEQRGVAVDHEAALKLERQRARGVAREKVAAARAERAGHGQRQGKLPALEDPDTRVLDGHANGARKLRADNEEKVLRYREYLKDASLSPERRQEYEEYLKWHGDAIDNPVAFRLKSIERDLRKKYSPEVVERLMKRFDARGNAVSRRAPPPAEQQLLPERTQVPEPADVVKQGRAAEAVEQGGGGPSAMDGLQEAPTRIGLVRTTPPEGLHGEAFTPNGDAHLFEFKAPDGTIFEAKVWYSPENPGELNVDSIHPKGAKFDDYIQLQEEYAGRMGPKNMRQIFSDLRREFPEAKKITAIRASGWNSGRNMEMRLPTPRPEAPTSYEFPGRSRAMSEAPPAPQARPVSDPFHDAPTRVGLVRTSPTEGYQHVAEDPVHTFEFKPHGSDEIFEVVVQQPETGVVYVESVKPIRARTVEELHGEVANSLGPKAMKSLSEEIARAFPGAKRITGQRYTGANPGHMVDVKAPEVTQPGAGGIDRTLRYGPNIDFPPMREPTAPSARAMQVQPSDPTLQYGREVDLPPMETPPMDHPGVQRFDVLGRMPEVKPGAGRHWGEQRGPRLSPEDAAAADEMMAARRAAAVGSGPSGPSPEPTAGARPRAMPPEASASMRAPEDTPAPAWAGGDPRQTIQPPPTWRQGEMPERTLVDRPVAVDRNPEVFQRPEATRATQVPRVQRPEPEQVREVRHYDGKTRLGQAPLDVRLQARPSAQEMAASREKGALLQVGLAGYEGARRAHNFVAAPIGALVGVTKESLRNPAVRARAISLFKLDRLAQVRPDVWGRVGATLSRAMEKGPEKYEATRHVYMLRDADFRAAEAEADKELEGLDEEALAAKLSGAGSEGGR